MKKLFLWLCFAFLNFSAFAQNDSLKLSFQSLYTISNKGYSPHWISTNKFGVLDENRNDGLVRLGAFKDAQYKDFKYGFGLDIIGKPYDLGSYLHQAYAYIKYKPFQFTFGKIEETHGSSYFPLSTGSMGISQNARPLPKMEIGVKEFTNVPFLNGFLKYKGSISHRWFEEDRHIQSPFLHEKSFYLQTGKIPYVNFYGGFIHYTIWGGEHPTQGKLPSSLNDYKLIFLGKDANKERSTGFGGEVLNALGDHQGFYDFGFNLEFEKVNVQVYHQTTFEDRSGWKLFHNPDKLLGIAVEPKSVKFIDAILYEHVNTMHQSGHGLPDSLSRIPDHGHAFGGRDDYYNNYLYRSGWTYQGRVMGNSLFTTNERGLNYFGSINNFNVAIVNNRFRAHHLGISGSFYKESSYKLLATYSENFGTHAGLYNGRYKWEYQGEDYIFNPALKQLYLMFEFNSKLPFNKEMEATAAIAADVGGMTNNFGVMLGLKWNGAAVLNSKSK